MKLLKLTGTRISLLLGLSLLVGGLALRLQARPGAAEERTYTIDETALPTTALEIVAVRHLNAEDFPASLELEVKNVSDKPMYGIYVAGIFKKGGPGISLYYSRPALAFPETMPAADDKPLLPGEKGLLRVEPKIAKGTQAAIANGSLPVPQTLKLELLFQLLSFGDGTGYQLTHKISRKS